MPEPPEFEAPPARPDPDVVDDLRSAEGGNADGAGHMVVRDPASGPVWDPNDGPPPPNTSAWLHRSTEAWSAAQGVGSNGQSAYREAGSVPASEVQDLLSLPPEERAARIAESPDLARIDGMLLAEGPGDAELPAGAAVGLSFPTFANVVDGAHGTAANTAVSILETMADGRPAFRPDLGLGGAQWFVTEGSPHVGPTAGERVTIPAEIEAPRGNSGVPATTWGPTVFSTVMPAAASHAMHVRSPNAPCGRASAKRSPRPTVAWAACP